MGVAPALVGVGESERRHGSRDRDDVPHLRPRTHRPAEPQHDLLAAPEPIEEAHAGDGRADRALSDGLEDDGPRLDGSPGRRGEHTGVERA